jgi:hypothetical protein
MVPMSEHQAAREFTFGLRPQLSAPVERSGRQKTTLDSICLIFGQGAKHVESNGTNKN